MNQPVEIMVVDDEPDLRALLEDYLGPRGFRVRTAADTCDLDRKLGERPADLIVLDVNMPGETGTAALARLRRAGCMAGIILLTAADALGDRLDGLGAGADDYVVKPFEPRELLARIRAVLRRLPPPAADAVPARAARPPVTMGRCLFDLDRRRLEDGAGDPVELTAMEFDLLSVFARHPRQILGREQLAQLAHGRDLAPGDRSVDIRILRLRQKIETDARAPRILKTVHGSGYVFDPEG